VSQKVRGGADNYFLHWCPPLKTHFFPLKAIQLNYFPELKHCSLNMTRRFNKGELNKIKKLWGDDKK